MTTLIAMSSPIEKFTKRMNADECEWDGDLVDFIQTGDLGFCGCGMPEQNLDYIRKGLEHINETRPESQEHDDWHPEWVSRGHEIFGNETSRYFFFYWADKEELTEHGGSVPGWLSDKGKELLEVLEILHSRGDFETDKCLHREGVTPGYDHVTCRQCGAIRISDIPKAWGPAAGRWFDDLAAAKFYKENGRLPE